MLLMVFSLFYLPNLHEHLFAWKVQALRFRNDRTECNFTWDKQHVGHMHKYNREVEDKRLL